MVQSMSNYDESKKNKELSSTLRYIFMEEFRRTMRSLSHQGSNWIASKCKWDTLLSIWLWSVIMIVDNGQIKPAYQVHYTVDRHFPTWIKHELRLQTGRQVTHNAKMDHFTSYRTFLKNVTSGSQTEWDRSSKKLLEIALNFQHQGNIIAFVH
jgi:hypothetical protein